MAETEKIIFETEVKTGQSANSIKGLKGELSDLTKQLGTLDSNSDAFKQAAAKAGQLREQIRGVNNAIENADPEKKFAPFVRTIGGLAGGFSAVQGAMALFGAESEDLQKTLVKVQGAMALSQGLNSMIEFKNDFADLGKLVVGNVTKAFSTLRGAIIATGIGAAAVAVGLLVANWKEFSTFVLKLIPGLETVGKFFGNIIQSVTDFVGITSQAGRELDSLNKKNLKTNETLKQQIEIWEAVGGKEKEIYNAKKQMIENDLETLRKRLKVNGELTKEELKQFKDLKNQLIIEDVNYNNFLKEEDAKRAEKKKADDEKEKARLKKLKDDEDKAFESRMTRLKLELKVESDIAEQKYQNKKREIEQLTEKADKDVAEIERIAKVGMDFAENENNSFAERQYVLDEYLKAGIVSEKYYADQSAEIAKQKSQAQIQGLMAVSQAAAGYAQLLGEQTAAGKALAIASTTIDTYVAAQAAFKNVMQSPLSKLMPDGGLTLGILAAGGAIASGIARVRAISAVQVPGGGGGGGAPSPTTGGGAPSFSPISQGIRIQGANEPIVTRNIKTQDNRVYVLESDITKTQNTVDGIKNKAKVK